MRLQRGTTHDGMLSMSLIQIVRIVDEAISAEVMAEAVTVNLAADSTL